MPQYRLKTLLLSITALAALLGVGQAIGWGRLFFLATILASAIWLLITLATVLEAFLSLVCDAMSLDGIARIYAVSVCVVVATTVGTILTLVVALFALPP